MIKSETIKFHNWGFFFHCIPEQNLDKIWISEYLNYKRLIFGYFWI